MSVGAKPAKAGRSAGIFAAVVLAVIVAIAVFDGSNWPVWVKAVHVIAVISWMVGLLYLPRLYVYHSEALELGIDGESRASMLEVMEVRLIKVIATPAMLVSWIAGLALIGFAGISGWFWVKLAAVLGLTVFHFYLAGARKKLAAGHPVRSPNGWRIMNEVPTLLLILVVVMVIVKPF
ncbi:MAG: protoporphyrinogen oxidase HemJ [Pseudomonadota bacterium]